MNISNTLDGNLTKNCRDFVEHTQTLASDMASTLETQHVVLTVVEIYYYWKDLADHKTNIPKAKSLAWVIK